MHPELNSEETRRLCEWSRTVEAERNTPFEAAQALAPWLGAHPGGPDGRRRATFGFWTPELAEGGIAAEDVVLELLLPPEDLDITKCEQQARFGVVQVETMRAGEYTWAVVEGLEAGTRDRIGPLYRISYRDRDGARRHVLDPLAASVPFGATAPAELYDVAGMLAARRDAAYFAELETEPDADGVPRVRGPVNMLEIHTATATEDGTLAGLAERYAAIAGRIHDGTELSAADLSFLGYDAVQLMPVEPTIVYEAGPPFFEEASPAPAPRPFTPEGLKTIARAWMDDVHEYCTVSRYAAELDPARARRNLEIRSFARERPWLTDNLRETDVVDRIRPTDGSVVFFGRRSSPDSRESLLFVASMEGAPVELTPLELPVPGPARGETVPGDRAGAWTNALSTRGLESAQAHAPIALTNGATVLFRREETSD